MIWMSGLDDWIIVLGALAAFACVLPGTFLVLKGMGMMGDAISHAILPGITIGFLVSGTRDSFWMFLGAAIAGTLAAVLSQFLHRTGRLERGAAMGIVFTSFFALGLIMMVQTADHIDLHPDCVLYGAIELAPLDTVSIMGWEVPRAFPILLIVSIINLAVILLFFKEMVISAFDPGMARSAGIPSGLMNHVLMIMTAATCVACFEVVGSILVVSLLVVPPAAARLLSDRLGVILILAVLIGIFSAVLGHLSAITVPGWFSGEILDTSTAGMMSVMAGVLFVSAWVCSPRHGLLMRSVRRISLQIRIISEDILGHLFRIEEQGQRSSVQKLRANIAGLTGSSAVTSRLAMTRLQRLGLIHRDGSDWKLSDEGRDQAAQIIRSHRLWETWLWRQADLAPDHVHDQAMRLEHVTDERMRADLEAQTGDVTEDPHGRPIPDRASAAGEQPGGSDSSE